ncbi:hypothetical protein ElyMa_002813700 [Elysia marginata]|uniref:Uncharacterized protein n=1 Tax=Elysia marginata TaxID=1093978 RepID=A0AAV4HUQ7_9GAST|nr:hypothetical protein ElyMa_002813700 [Elysia marginata]
MRAETMMVDLLAELNLPIAALDKLSQSMEVKIPDSKIAKDFQRPRTKGIAVARDMARIHPSDLFARMRPGPFTFYLQTDQMTNLSYGRENSHPESNSVTSELLSLPVLRESATNEKWL